MTLRSQEQLIDILDINSPLNPSFELFWFNSEEYAGQHQGGMLFYYQKEAVQLFVRVYEKEGYLVSPWRAPFGGIEFSTGTHREILYEFVQELVQKARETKVKGIKITVPPECYDLSKADLMDEILIHAGFEVSVTELNYHIDTNSGAFEEFVHSSEKRRLRKCLNAGFESKLDSSPDYALIHQLIVDCRKRKGFPLSMNSVEFENMFRNFPDRYLPFVVKDGDTLIAAAIGVKVRSDILYNFLPADHKDYLDYSPSVLLNKTMYDYCRENGCKLYDLGIATVGGIRNEGLIRFKEHLGGVLSHKYSYQINF